MIGIEMMPTGVRSNLPAPSARTQVEVFLMIVYSIASR